MTFSFFKTHSSTLGLPWKMLPDDWSLLHLYANLERTQSEKVDQSRTRYKGNLYSGHKENSGAVCYGLSQSGAIFLLDRAFPVECALDGITNHLTVPESLVGEKLVGYRNKGFVVYPHPCKHVGFKTTLNDRPEQWGMDGLAVGYTSYVAKLFELLKSPGIRFGRRPTKR